MDILSSLESTQDLISLPVVATRILTLLDNEHVHVRELSDLVETDAPIALKVLRLANSPVFALRNEVTSITQAIATIGMNRMMNIVLGVSIYSKFVYLSNSSVAPFVKKFWEHSASTAGVAKTLATGLKKNFQDGEFIGGLIHDIGKLCMIQYDAERYSQVLALMANDNMSDAEAELREFGVTHTQVGEVLTRAWRLPNALHSVVTYHDSPEAAGANSGMTSLVRLADLYCEKTGVGLGEAFHGEDLSESSSWKNLCSLYPDLRGVNINELCVKMQDDFSRASSLVNVMLSD